MKSLTTATVPTALAELEVELAEIGEQVDLLLSADGSTWKRAHDLLDPERDRGIDYPALITVLSSRIARFRGNKTRMKQVRYRLLRESSK